MNGTTDEAKELEFDDVEFLGGADSAPTETIPDDTYYAKLVGFRGAVDKPDWKIDQDLLKAQRKYPATNREDIDPKQYEFTFEITHGDYAGTRVILYTSRTFHERSTAGMAAAALMGMDKFVRSVMQALGGTRILYNKPCRIDVVEIANKFDPDNKRNYVNAVKKMPPPRPQKEQDKRQREAVPRQQLAGYPSDQGDDNDIAF